MLDEIGGSLWRMIYSYASNPRTTLKRARDKFCIVASSLEIHFSINRARTTYTRKNFHLEKPKKEAAERRDEFFIVPQSRAPTTKLFKYVENFER